MPAPSVRHRALNGLLKKSIPAQSGPCDRSRHPVAKGASRLSKPGREPGRAALGASALAKPGRKPVLGEAILPFLAACLLLSGCETSAPKHPVVARVGDREITTVQLQEFAAGVPAGLHEGKTDAEADSALLKAMIDKTLLLMEAGSQAIESIPEFAAEIAAFEEQQLAQKYTWLKVHRTISIAREELLEQYRASGRDRALRPGVVIVASPAAAQEVLEELRAGAEFSEVAARRSLEEHTRQLGGDMGRYIGKDEAQTPLLPLFDLEAGGLTEPVPVLHQGERHYAVFKLLDEIPVPLQDVENEVAEELVSRKRQQRTGALTDSLAQVHGRRLHGEVAGMVAGRAATGELQLSAADLEQPIASFSGGRVTVGQFLEKVKDPDRKLMLPDSGWVARTAMNLAGSRIVQIEARALGLHRDEAVAEAVGRKREELLISHLRRRSVDQGIEATEDEARAYFEAHPEKFRHPETTVVSELLLATETEALQVKEQLERGVPPEGIEVEHATRSDHWSPEGADGELRLNVYSQTHYPRVYEEARSLEAGQVGGPVLIPEGYSVFKVVEIVAAKPKPFHEASRKRAAAYVRIEKAKRKYVAFVRSLQEKYGVETYPGNLPRLVEGGRVRLAVE